MNEKIPEIVGKLTDKVPTLTQWQKHGSTAVTYVFAILFIILFLQDRFSDDNKCSDQIATLGKVIDDKDKQIQSLNERVRLLEEYIYVKAGVLKQVEEKVQEQEQKIGGSK